MGEKFRVLMITGGYGFIGSTFIRFWLRNYRQCKIINLDKLTYAGNVNNLKDINDNANYHFVRGDIGDFVFVDEIVKKLKPDCIVNFAAETHVDRSLAGSSVFMQTNVVGTNNLLEAALRHKIKRFHQVSTLDVIESDNKDDIFNSGNPYVASKVASDSLVRLFYQSFGLPITITKCSNNYGPYQHPEKFIPRVITNLIDDQKVPVYGSGKQIRDWLYVEDNCRAIDAVLTKGTIGETYYVGSATKDINNLTLVKMILTVMGKTFDWIEFVPDRPGHDYKYFINLSKINQEVGWSPRHKLEDMLAITVDWYQQNEAWWRLLKEETDRLYKKLDKRKSAQ